MQKQLTPQQRSLIQALFLRSNVISEAAAQVGISPTIALAWMQKPYMRTAFTQARKEAITRLIEEAHAGKMDTVLRQTPSIEPNVAESFQESAAISEWLASHDGEELAKVDERTQQWISELQMSFHLPIEKVLSWR